MCPLLLPLLHAELFDVMPAITFYYAFRYTQGLPETEVYLKCGRNELNHICQQTLRLKVLKVLLVEASLKGPQFPGQLFRRSRKLAKTEM